MPKTYAEDVRLRTVALALSTSVEEAAKATGIGKDTILRWLAEAPEQPAMKRAMDLALSELTAKTARGDHRGIRDLAVTFGILRDKWARYSRAEIGGPARNSALQAKSLFYDWLEESATDADLEDLDNLIHAMVAIRAELLREANAEPDQPHRPALLTWFSGREDEEAGDVLEWAKARTAALVEAHGSLAAWGRHDQRSVARATLASRRAHVLWREAGVHAHEAEGIARELTPIDDPGIEIVRAELFPPIEEEPE